jgi:AraC-like DNA-binding protein
MDGAIIMAVERAIATMRENLDKEVTIDDLARAAMFSKFHFSRVFRRVTGVSPGRFLTALRIHQAKRLLSTTSLKVTDVCNRVGYNSVGTFSSKFSRSVGLAPAEYRRLKGCLSYLDCPEVEEARPATTVHGEVRLDCPQLSPRVFVGLFPDRIAEGRPPRCTVLTGPGRYRLDRLPRGTWYVLGHSLTDDPADCAPWIARQGPIVVGADTTSRVADLRLRPMRAVDPPVLVARPDLHTRERLLRAS